jgi:hypothetical protein
MNASEPLMTCRKRKNGDQKRKESLAAISLEETCLLTKRSPALRWHDFYTGFYKERENQSLDAKKTIQAGDPYKNLSINAKDWDGVICSSEENSVMEWERRDHILNNWNETTGYKPEGSK